MDLKLSDIRQALRDASEKEREAFAAELLKLISKGAFNSLSAAGRFNRIIEPGDKSDPTR